MDEGFFKQQAASSILKDTTQFRSLVGALLYISVCMRPAIAVSTGILGRNVSNPSEACWVAAKRVAFFLAFFLAYFAFFLVISYVRGMKLTWCE